METRRELGEAVAKNGGLTVSCNKTAVRASRQRCLSRSAPRIRGWAAVKGWHTTREAER